MDHIAGLGKRVASELTCFAGGGVYDHLLPPVVRALTMRPGVRDLVHALSERGCPGCASGAVGIPVDDRDHHRPAGGQCIPLRRIVSWHRSSESRCCGDRAERSVGLAWVNRAPGEILHTFGRVRGIEIVEHPLLDGHTVWADDAQPAPAAVVFAQPNYLGVVEDPAEPVDLAHRLGALAIASFDPMLLGVLRSPGATGCDVAFAEGQPLGNLMSFGGPILGVFATTRALMRRIPGRLVGRTVDAAGRIAYTLTLRTREQDIRREKASSNICTNQTLNAIAAAIHLAWLGPHGLAEVGRHSVAKAHYLAGLLQAIPGVAMAVSTPFAREFPVLLQGDADRAIADMAGKGILAGIPLARDYPEFPGGLLIAVTERRTRAQLDGYATALREVMHHA